MKLRELLSKEFYVYKIANLVNGKIYVGKTLDIDERWNKHIEISKSKKKPAYQYLHKSISKYGKENFQIAILEQGMSECDAFDREKFWIQELDSKNPDVGMNLTAGGEGVSGLKWTDESKSSISGPNNHNFGKPISIEVKEKISISLSGSKNPFFGQIHSDEVIDFLKNREISDEVRSVISTNCRGENQWNAKFSNSDILEIRKKWDNREYTQTELAKQYGVKPNTISQIVNRKRWTHI
jgi:group I intron endonuclease